MYLAPSCGHQHCSSPKASDLNETITPANATAESTLPLAKSCTHLANRDFPKLKHYQQCQKKECKWHRAVLKQENCAEMSQSM